MTIGEKIQKLRKQRGLSQEALAEKVTVTRQTISKWELGQSTPDLDFIAQLSDIFNVSSDMPNKSFENMGLSKRDTIKLSHSMRSLDFTSQLNGITCPVTILCGEKDSANLKASKKLNELLPQATLQIVPGAGHEINKDAPEVIAAILNM